LVNVAVIYSCVHNNTSRTASSNGKFLADEILWNQQNLGEIRAISQMKIPWSGDKNYPFIISDCHRLNIMCLKYNTVSLSHSYPPSTGYKFI